MKLSIHFLVIIFTTFLLTLLSCVQEPIPDPNAPPTGSLTDTTILNVSYGAHTRHVYDLYLPANRDTNTPVLIMIHGGGWKAGQKEDFNYYLQLIKAKWQNVAIVNMNYRLASNGNNIHHHEMMADIQAVISKILANQSSYHISTNMGMIGASAGGQLAMIYAYKYNTNIKCVGNIFGPSIISDWEWYNSTNLWLGGYTGDVLTEYVGQSWDTTTYNAVSPYWNVSNNTQPTITFHGSLDPVVPVYQSQWMHGKLDNLGVINQYHEYLAFHSFDDNQSNDVINKLVAFFKIHIN